jgi:hypothetical protein
VADDARDATAFERDYWAENWRRTLARWQDRQSLVRFALLLLTILGFGWIKNEPLITVLGLSAAVFYLLLRFCVFTPMSMWQDATSAIAEYKDQNTPRLRLVFRPEKLPYIQEQRLVESGHVYTDRRYRVGIQNDSGIVIQNVRVVLETFHQLYDDGTLHEAKPDQPVLIEHALNIMGWDTKTGLVDVAPGDRPTAFVDVVVQPVGDDGTGDWMSPCYASGHLTMIFSRASFVLGLRVEGGGTRNRAQFEIGATLENRRMVMIPFVRPRS